MDRRDCKNAFAGLLSIVFLTITPAVELSAQVSENAERPPEVLLVGTKVSPPFAIKNSDGSWSGISIELWDHLADELDLEYELVEMSLDQMLTELEAGRLDAAVAAISVTSDRHERVGFCHPHFSTGLGIAVSARERTTAWSLVNRIVSSRLVKIIGSMIGIVLVCGLLFWVFERKTNTLMFGGKRRSGIGMGIWWSTILLFGHKGVVPVSVMGRILATFAMLASLILLSILTGIITSVLTVQQLDTGIASPTDLNRVRVATISSSTSEDYLRQRRIFFRAYPNPDEALRAIEDGKADAVVYDAALLKYMAAEQFANRIDVLPVVFNVQEYAIALQADSSLRKPLNEALLRYRESDAWGELLFRFLGE
ncbi:transporter substrate-binding domain-containing protein [Roseiconus nitratireducens]|uniref:Transporter substrate-binding domain-containing protein n=1 Tax=Roseiconus nitratireducens TaxID=2605748 RepID=A0A5M6D0E7_9BACT|nr:transporter substrate-binding domain-containing protein [Roseiconus nitratireducens]KAA5539772.1 transporter substrate-binding domain-containing protein [Roseiconus nitratireducens]